MNGMFKRKALNIIFTVTFDQFDASLLDKSINFFKNKHTDCQFLGVYIYIYIYIYMGF